jgi:hypothetical protein
MDFAVNMGIANTFEHAKVSEFIQISIKQKQEVSDCSPGKL